MRYLFLFIFLSFVPLAKGQVNDIDDRNEYLDSLYSLCRDLFENHPDSTIKIGQEIILKSRNKNDYYLSLGLYCVGLGHSQIDDIKSAILYFDSAQAIQLENNYYHALTQNYISHSGLYYDLILVHQNNNNVELMNQTAKTGIKYCERAVSQAKKLNDSTYIAQGYGNMAAFYYYIYEYENAKNTF